MSAHHARPIEPAPPAHTLEFSLDNIPPRPALLMALQREMQQQNPNTRKFSHLIRRDVAMAGTLLHITNSAYFNPGRRITSVEDAIVLLGLNQCNAIVSGLLLKESLGFGNHMMARFWEGSEKRAIGLSILAKRTRHVSSGIAYSFGLFCDTGIPLLKRAFPGYLETLLQANRKAADEFLEVENKQHGINHTIMGALLAERWSLAPEIVQAIRVHHSHRVLSDKSFSPAVRTLIALNYVAEKALQEYRGQPESLEWMEGGEHACTALGISSVKVDSLCNMLLAQFRTSNSALSL